MICAFYSFKGGVGRSMALANVAELLYQKGLKVLMVDFDLEAPGLDRYFSTKNARYTVEEFLDKCGLIDMLHSYKKSYSLMSMDKFHDKKFKDREIIDRIYYLAEPLSNYVTPIYEENNLGGALSIIGAGRRGNDEFERYSTSVRYFDWNDFYNNFDGELFFEWFRREAEAISDIVLIDSRTGITEMGGVSTHQLADLVVIFVASNQQNLSGVLTVAKSLSNPELMKGTRNGRPISLIFVPSRVEHGERDLLDNFAVEFENKLGCFMPKNVRFRKKSFLDLKVPYVPYYSYNENVAVRDPDRASSADLINAFERLISTIAQLVPKDSKLSKLYSEDDINKSLYFYKLGMEAQLAGEFRKAQDFYKQSLEIKQMLGDKKGVSESLRQLGRVTEDIRNLEEARKLYQQSLEIAQQIGDKNGVLESLQQLGSITRDVGDYEEARKLHQQSLEIAQEIGDKKNIVMNLGSLGVIASETGSYEEARRLFQQSLEIEKELGDKYGIARTLHQLGIVAHSMKNCKEAQKLYQQSLEIEKELGDKYGIARTLHQLGMIAQDTGNYEEARNLYQQSLETRQNLQEDRRTLALTLAQMALLEEKLGNTSNAIKLTEQAEAIFSKLGLATYIERAQIQRRQLERTKPDLPDP